MVERIIVLGILALCIIYFIRVNNKIVKLDVKVHEAYADIEVSLIKRYDILTQSLDIAQKYMGHEEQIMTQLIKVRNGNSLGQTEKILENQRDVVKKIYAIGEAYPQLMSNELFKTLQYQISDTNEHLSASKRLYNANVSRYNQAISVFPASIVAFIAGKRSIQFLKDESKVIKGGLL